ncbi:hypothetical protein [Caballeronia pedi]|uniref:hypothetical protein n=1 Tax=Caballeronia pedi TaxID=1777141 RepID=UPI00077234FF|nr:hypothetical protein [Caballeronia pedi]
MVTDGNSRCDSNRLIELILAELPPEPGAANDQRQRIVRVYLGTHEAKVRERLKRCVVNWNGRSTSSTSTRTASTSMACDS